VIELKPDWDESHIKGPKERWGRLSDRTDSADRERARRCLGALYRWKGYPIPRILWFGSPQAAFYFHDVLANFILDSTGIINHAGLADYERLHPQTAASRAWLEAKDVLAREKPPKPGNGIEMELFGYPFLNLRDETNKTLGPQYAALREKFWKPSIMGAWWSTFHRQWGGPLGTYELEEAAWFEFVRNILGQTLKSRWLILLEGLLGSCGFWWVNENTCCVTERPSLIQRDAFHRLHCDLGPAMQFRDGTSLFALQGVLVPEKALFQPRALTAQEIDEVRQSEVKRGLVELLGLNRFLGDLGMVEIDRVDQPHDLAMENNNVVRAFFGLQGGRLFRKENNGDEPKVYVVLKNSTMEPDGCRKEFFIRVPPAIKTVREAVAWTFGMEEMEYAPLKES